MTSLAATLPIGAPVEPVDRLSDRLLASGRVVMGGSVVLLIVFACLISLPWTAKIDGPWYFDLQHSDVTLKAPAEGRNTVESLGTDRLGRGLLPRVLFGGCISLAIGIAAATISLVLGVGVGLVAGYRGGWTDAILMRVVDILYGLPYILIVVLIKFALEDSVFVGWLGMTKGTASIFTMFIAIGAVSWLTMARVVRGQVLSWRNQPFIEAARAAGLTEMRIFRTHLLPNLLGPVIVYATLTVPRAILEESLLSFLGVGVQPPVPTWGSLASDGMGLALNPINSRWWLLLFPCSLLAVTLLALNFLGDGLRDVMDPKRGAARL